MKIYVQSLCLYKQSIHLNISYVTVSVMKTQNQIINIRVELSAKANKNLEGYVFLKQSKTKAEAINKILEELSLKEDMTDWLNDIL